MAIRVLALCFRLGIGHLFGGHGDKRLFIRG